ncbi:MAG: hypothetical protein SGILL_009197 [Bacillariaceae sp.]
MDYSKMSDDELRRLLQERNRQIASQARQIARSELFRKTTSLEGMLEEFAGGIPDMRPLGNLESSQEDDNGGGVDFSIDENLVTAEHLDFAINTTRIQKDEAGNDHEIDIMHFYPNVPFVKLEDGTRVLEIRNEAAVANYVEDVLRMVLQSLGLLDEMKVYKKMTLHSVHHDLILVQLKRLGIALVIQAKMPGEALFQSKEIAEQVSHSLMLQYRLGNRKPFVLLSSYRTACLCHLAVDPRKGEEKESTEGEEEQEQNEYKHIIQKAAGMLRDGKGKVSLKDLQISKTDESNAKPAASTKKDVILTLHSIPHSLENSMEDTKSSRKRKECSPEMRDIKTAVKYSQPFELKNMLQGVALAVAASLLSKVYSRSETPNEKNPSWPTNGSCIDGAHPWVDEVTLGWTWVHGICIDYMNHSNHSSGLRPKFFLLKTIGQGMTGQVSLAVDEHGQACVLKFYRPSDHESQEDFDEKKKMVKDELGLWGKLQSFYVENGHVEALKLNNQNVLRMPVCFPVPLDKRQSVLNTVETKLREFYNQGYFYEWLRWKHVGCRRKVGSDDLEIIMLDLESLVRKRGKRDQSVIDRQISQLEQRADKEPIAATSGWLHL